MALQLAAQMTVMLAVAKRLEIIQQDSQHVPGSCVESIWTVKSAGK